MKVVIIMYCYTTIPKNKKSNALKKLHILEISRKNFMNRIKQLRKKKIK